MSKNEYFVDDTCFDDNTANDYKTLDDVNDEIAKELLASGLYEGKTYEEVLEYVKNN